MLTALTGQHLHALQVAAMETVMASFGDALAALDDFRSDLTQALVSSAAPMAEALAFRGAAALRGGPPVRAVHATGVGISSAMAAPGRDDFVVKVFVFDAAAQQAAQADALFQRKQQGVPVEVDVLPMQVAYVAANPAQHRKRRRPVPGGVEIGPLGGQYVGTLPGPIRNRAM